MRARRATPSRTACSGILGPLAADLRRAAGSAPPRARRISAIGVLPPDRQPGEIEARLVPIYLLHRYQTEAVARLVGGADYAYPRRATAGRHEGRRGRSARRARSSRATLGASSSRCRPTCSTRDAAGQRLRAHARILRDGARRCSTRSARSQRPRADPAVPVRSARLNRLAWQHARDANQPGVADVLTRLPRDLAARHASATPCRPAPPCSPRRTGSCSTRC